MRLWWLLGSLTPREWLVGCIAAGYSLGLVLVAVKLLIWGWGKGEKRASDKWWRR